MAKKRDNLLREAIADAKQVRETALANAKLALEEAFTPHLTSMLAAKLKSEAEDEEEEELEEGDDPDAADGYGAAEGGETDYDATTQSTFKESKRARRALREDDEDDIDIDFDDDDEELGEAADVQDDAAGLKSSEIGDPDPSHEYGESDPKEPASSARSSSDIENEPLHTVSEDVDDDALDLGDDEDEEDLDLESVIKELEADVDDDEDVDVDYDVTEDVDVDDDEEELDEDDEPADTDDRELPDMEDEPVTEGDDPATTDGYGSSEGGETDPDAITASTFKAGTESMTEPLTEDDDVDIDLDDDDDDEEIDLAEVLKEIEDEEKEDELETEVKKLRKELKEYRRAVGFLRSKLNEVNLLNAKLLYTNRLFRDYNMDVRTKMRVVENFDRATTVREAKLVYATIAESFRGKGTVSRKARPITEGLASRKVGSTAPKGGLLGGASDSTPTILREGADLAARLKKLAGIKG